VTQNGGEGARERLAAVFAASDGGGPGPQEHQGGTAATRGGWGVPPRTALTVALVCAAAVLGLLARGLWERPGVSEVVMGGNSVTAPAAVEENAAVAAGPAQRSAAGTAGVAAAGGTEGAAPEPSGTRLLVHVVGAVREPGVVTLTAGARVFDALKAAGGAGRKADLALLNLARPVVDGEQIRVPARGETPAALQPSGQPSGALSSGAQVPGAPAAGATGTTGALVDLNSADEAALDGLPGVGPVLAGRILQWRAQNGRFTSVDELAEVSGIGERLLERLRPLVTVQR
jgi:competence protein ComEA